MFEHPGFLGGLVPVVGSGRQALAHFEDGDWGWGLLHGALAISDVLLVKSVVTNLWRIGGNVIRPGRMHVVSGRGPISTSPWHQAWEVGDGRWLHGLGTPPFQTVRNMAGQAEHDAWMVFGHVNHTGRTLPVANVALASVEEVRSLTCTTAWITAWSRGN